MELLLTFAPQSSAVFRSSFCLSLLPLSFPAELFLFPGVSGLLRPSSSPPPSSSLPHAKTHDAGWGILIILTLLKHYYSAECCFLTVRFSTYFIFIQNNP